jgi:hypothetical protein
MRMADEYLDWLDPMRLRRPVKVLRRQTGAGAAKRGACSR